VIDPAGDRPAGIASSPRDPPAGAPSGPLLSLFRSQEVAFLAVGATNTVVGYCFFLIFELAVGARTGYVVVLLLAHVTSVVWAFVLYRRLVFRVRGHVWRDLARFELVYLSSLSINLVLLPVGVEVLDLPVLVAQSLIVVVVAAISFFGHKHFTFRRRRDSRTGGMSA
jgi:putative flippase GtrA